MVEDAAVSLGLMSPEDVDFLDAEVSFDMAAGIIRRQPKSQLFGLGRLKQVAGKAGRKSKGA